MRLIFITLKCCESIIVNLCMVMTEDSANGGNASSWSLTCVKCETNCDTYESRFENYLPVFENEDIIFECAVVLDGRKVQACLTSTQICWYVGKAKHGKPSSTKHVINISNVIAINYEQKLKKNEGEEIQLFPSQCFLLHYATRVKHKWKAHSLLFDAVESSKCQVWVDGISNILKDFIRPKRLLVFVNPVGGKKLAEKIYREKAAPYFETANIAVTKITTERVNHARDYIASEDVSMYDGIVCVGGDGLCSEIANGMLEYKDDLHEVKQTDKCKSLMLGIIPAGSTDTVAYCTMGTNDPVTAAMHIILGHQLSVDLCSVWQDGAFLKYSLSLMGYGYFGDIIKDSENMRWMGPHRYDMAGFKKFMANKSYEGEVSFLREIESENANEVLECKSECKRCSSFADNQDSPTSKGSWQRVHGQFISVIGANITCRCARSPTGISPLSHIGDGYIHLILIRKTTRAKYLHHLIKVSDKTLDQFNFNFIEVYRVKEFTFTPIQPTGSSSECRNRNSSSRQSETSVWNIDGELVESPHLHIKVHRQLISLYARGIEE